MTEQFVELKENKGICSSCGNSPSNHAALYVLSSSQVLFSGLLRRLSRWSWYRRLENRHRNFSFSLERFNARLGTLFRIIRYSDDVTRARTYRSQVVWEEAKRRGISMQQIRIFGSYSDSYRAYVRGSWIHFESIPIPPELEQTSYSWMDDKYVLGEILSSAGVPTPRVVCITRECDVEQAYKSFQGKVIMKPREGSRGRHTTTNIQSLADARSAFRVAQQLCHFVVMSMHLEGNVCRGTVVGGKLVGFFEAEPPYVIGDGVSTIAQLVDIKNRAKPERVKDIILDTEKDAFLARSNRSRSSIPEGGERIELSHRTGRLFGGHTRELLTSVHPKLRAQIERAAQALDVPVVGFDLIIKDPERDPENQEWGIIEANSLPFIDLHYLPLHGTPSNVAAHVWDLWETKKVA